MSDNQQIDPEQLFPTRETAALLGMHEFTLHRWRCEGRTDLPWVKIAGRIRYRRKDIVAYIESGMFGKGVTPTRPFGSRDNPPANDNGHSPQPGKQ